MATNAFTIWEGMEVFGTNGEKIGKVAQVWPSTAEYASSDVNRADTLVTPRYDTTSTGEELAVEEVPRPGGTADVNLSSPGGTVGDRDMPGPSSVAGTTGTTTQTATRTGYFKVDQGGFLGIGAKDLFVPFTAVADVVPGKNVTLNCTKDEGSDLFASKPDFLDQDNGPEPLT